MFKSIFCAGIALSAVAAVPASAASYIFNYNSISGPLENATGSFSTNSSGTITSIAGAVTNASGTSAITGLSTYASADNKFSSTQPYFDFSGLSFRSVSGISFNLYSNAGSYLVTDTVFDPTGASPLSDDAIVRLTVSAVPEPAAWTMLLLGIGALGSALRGRRVAMRVSFAG